MTLFTNRAYDLLKPIALIWLPAIATLYTALAAIWGVGDVTAVVGSLSAVDGFLGVVLHLSTNPTPATPAADGKFVVDKTSDPTKDIYRLELETDPTDLEKQQTITLAVTHSV